MKNLILIFVFGLLPFGLAAQTGNDTLFIQTSAQCGTCKKKIEHDMAFLKGVKQVRLDVKTKRLMVVYNPAKNNPQQIRNALAGIGYDADSVAADPKAYSVLPDCCKKGGHD